MLHAQRKYKGNPLLTPIRLEPTLNKTMRIRSLVRGLLAVALILLLVGWMVHMHHNHEIDRGCVLCQLATSWIGFFAFALLLLVPEASRPYALREVRFARLPGCHQPAGLRAPPVR